MATLYKLTNKKKQTKNNTTWGEGVTHSGTGEGPLCSKGWIHAYRHPLLAVFFNPLHGNFEDPLLWEAEGEVALDDGMKVGCQTLTTVRQIELPEMSTVQRVACGILAAQEVCREKEWNKWAERWLSGEDRSRESTLNMRQEMYNDPIYLDEVVARLAATVSSVLSAASTILYAEAVEEAAYAAYYAIKGGEIDILPFLQKAMEYK